MERKITVEVDHGLQIIRLAVCGDMTIDTHETIKKRVDEAAVGLESADPLFVLQDGRRIGKVDSATRKAILADLAGGRPHCTAIFGVPIAQRIFMNILFRVSGLGSLRFFDAEQTALTWLQERREAACGQAVGTGNEQDAAWLA